MAFHVGDQKDVALLLSFIECSSFIPKGRDGYEFIGDMILPARSALEFIRATFAAEFEADEAATAEFMAKLDGFDAFVRANAEAFNSFFAYEHAQLDRVTALEDWVCDEDGRNPEVPAAHWWWAPISSGEA